MPRNGFHRKAAAVLAVTLTIAAIAWIGTRQERTAIVGKIDPGSGTRCRFTLSSVWQCEYRPLNTVDPDTGWKTGLDSYVCTLRPYPVTRWVNSRVLHLQSADLPEIRLITYKRSDLPAFNFLHRFADGYPEPILEKQARIVTHSHLEIDGCKATVVHLEKTEQGKLFHGTQLLVDVSDHTLVYDLSGFAPASSSEVDAEIQAILLSFHIEKVVVPSDARQRSAQHAT